MEIFNSIELPQVKSRPAVVTIGSFDGVHLGHKVLLNRALDLARQSGGDCCVITFANHPSEVFRPHAPTCKLCTVAEKLKHIEAIGCDILFLLKFTAEFASQTADVFLSSLIKALPVSHIVLGHDAVIGRGQEGDKDKIIRLSKILGFGVEHLAPFSVDGIVVSSSAIREAIKRGDFLFAKRLLGRPYSFHYPLTECICLPPEGSYSVLLKCAQIEKMEMIRIEGGSVSIPKGNEPCEVIFL